MKVHHISPDALRPGGNDYFIGEARVQPLLGQADGIDIVVVSFSPGARTYLLHEFRVKDPSSWMRDIPHRSRR